MKKYIGTMLAVLLSSQALAIGSNFEKEEVTALSGIASTNFLVFNETTEYKKVELELLNGEPLPESIRSTMDITAISVPPKTQVTVPLYVKLPKKGKFKVVICAKDEPLFFGKKGGSDVNIVVRSCATTVIKN